MPVILLLLWAAVLGAQDVDTLDVYVFGASYHPGHASEFQQWNPGLGLGLSRLAPGSWYHFGAEGVVAGYRDSFGDPSWVAAAGPKIILGDLDGFHGEFSAPFGYLHGSGMDGWALLPHVGLGWGPVTLEGFYAPQRDFRENAHPPGHPGYPMTSSMGAWLKYSIRL